MIAALASPLVRWAGVGLALAAVAGFAWLQTARLDAARADAATYKAAAEESARTLAAKVADEKLAARIVGDYAAEIAKLQEEARVERTSIAAAPVTNACGGSPAIQRLLDGVQ